MVSLSVVAGGIPSLCASGFGGGAHSYFAAESLKLKLALMCKIPSDIFIQSDLGCDHNDMSEHVYRL